MKYNKMIEAFKGPSTEHLLNRPEIKTAFKVLEAYKTIKFSEFSYSITDRKQLTYDERQRYRYILIKLLEDEITFDESKLMKFAAGYSIRIVPRGEAAKYVEDEYTEFEFEVDSQLKFQLKLHLSTKPAQHSILRIAGLGPFDEISESKFNAAVEIMTTGRFTLYPSGSTGSGIPIDPDNY